MTQARQRAGRGPGAWTAALSALVLPVLLLALLMPLGGCSRLASPRSRAPERVAALPATAPAGRLQEVEPPAGVRELSAALAVHRPRLRITAPEAGQVLGAGPWRLGLELNDWPLVDAGPLGLGPHLVVQVDRQSPLRIHDWSGGDPATGRLEVELPELEPGSHLVSVYAARPWGEAVKGPGASAQLLVHRLSADPLSLPAPGSPRLLPVSPAALASAEPVLIDWLLDNAPLQGLREGDGQWRLRITINGDSFLVDQNTPLWLKGFRTGSNAVLLELLDGLGEPLNPPFNSAVRELVIDATAQRPAWLQAHLSDAERAQLLGQPRIEPDAEAASTTSTREVQPAEPASSPAGTAPATTPAEASAPTLPARERAASAPQAAETGESAAGTLETQPTETEPIEAAPLQTEPPPPAAAAPGQTQREATKREQTAPENTEPRALQSPGTGPAQPPPAEAPQPEMTNSPAPGAPPAAGPDSPSPIAGDKRPLEAPAPPAPASASQAAPPERITPGSSLQGSAREQVRDDGSLIQPRAAGPLSGLRNRLQGRGGEA